MLYLVLPLLVLVCQWASAFAPSDQSLVSKDSLGERLLRARQLHSSGVSYHMQGHYAGAIVDLLEALRYDSSAVILMDLARSYAAYDRYQNALFYSEKAFARDSSLIVNLELLADLYLASYQGMKAVEVYERLTRLKEKNTSYLQTLARLYDDFMPANSIPAYERLSELAEDEFTLRRLATLYELNGQVDSFISANRRLLRIDADDPMANSGLVMAYLHLNKLDSAYALYTTAKSEAGAETVEQVFQSILENLATRDTLSTSDRSIAVRILGEHKTRKFFDAQTLWLSGVISSALGDSLAAADFYTRATESGDKIDQMFFRMSILYQRRRQITDAISFVNRALAYRPTETVYLSFKSALWRQSGRLDSALVAIQSAIAHSDPDVTLWTSLGDLLQETGSIAASDSAYERALEIDDHYPVALNNYAYSLAQRELRLNDALRYVTYALDIAPGNESYLDTKGWVFFQMRQYDSARVYIEKAASGPAPSNEILEHLSAVYLKLNRVDKAEAVLRRLLERSPGDATLRQRLEAIK